MDELSSENIYSLIKNGESETLEFKESFNDEALETIGAFSNVRGGIILVGVTDAGKICGLQIGKKTLEDVSNRMREATDPRIQPSLSLLHLEEKYILVIKVLENTGTPVSVRGRFYKRSGRTNQRMSHEDIMQRITAYKGMSWDARIEPDTSLDDLDLSLVERCMEVADKLGRRTIPVQTTPGDFLKKLDLVKEGVLTRAALLLFGKNPGAYFPSAFLKMGRFRSPTLIVDDREIHGALVDQVDEAMTWFRERLTTGFKITGNAEREVSWEYPLDAIREAVVNLLCHRLCVA